ncbi:hypothetical protein GGH99_003527 [Coemansia sp. RSA 1285]|nr:hypothetical protein GGH99_003527 [Coemansia sp. RSA 1285]
MQLEETGFSKALWPHIKELQIYHWHGHTRRQRRSENLPESLSKLNRYLLHNLPSLSSVEYNSLGDYRYYSEFPLNGLLASTLSRLTELRIHSGLVPDLGASAFLPMLSSLTLNCPMVECAAHLPHIFAKSLVHLHIGFSSAETIWNRFYVGLGSHDLVFSKLRSLELEYTVPVVENATCKCKSKDNSLNYCSKSQSSPFTNKTYTLAGNSSDGAAVGGGITSKICGNRLESVYYSYSTSDEGDDDTVISSDYEEFWATAAPNSDKYLTCSKNNTDKLGAIRQQSPSFPHLEQLCIRKYPYPVTNVLRHFTVDQIPHVSIRDIGRSSWAAGIAAECVRDMKSLRVDVARSAFVGDRYTSSQDEEDDAERRYQVWINRLFSVSSVTLKQLRLDAPTVEPVTLPDIVGLTNLTELSLGMKMDLGSVPNMLARLPRLLKLAMHVHPQSSWRLRNEGVLGGSGYSSHQDEADDLRMLSRLPPLSNSLQSLVVYVGMVDLSVYCRGTHKRNLSTNNKCCRRCCRRCEQCTNTSTTTPTMTMVKSSYCEEGYLGYGCGNEEECETFGHLDGRELLKTTAVSVMPVERELVWMLARIPSLAALKTERSTSHAIAKCIGELVSHKTALPHISHLDCLRISVWE